MDADVVLLVPARVGPTVRYGEAYERSQAGIRAALPLAEELGVTIAVENVWNNFLLSPLEFARYIDEFGSPRVKAYFDVGNIIKYGWAQDWILTLGERIVRLHWKDYDRKSNEWKALGEGSVDWPETRQALRDIGFRGFGTVEMKAGDEAYLRDICERMKAIGRGERPSAA
ncbi:MAG: fructoselysine 3-epimerase [candidate division BRC1 bacterium ADurb.BinA364]|nr:MAG: fructoselysine 3-epimerase [candidate division BRC1 bacterium ADurb.BinA364]